VTFEEQAAPSLTYADPGEAAAIVEHSRICALPVADPGRAIAGRDSSGRRLDSACNWGAAVLPSRLPYASYRSFTRAL
jgi:hypothetical protein